MKLGRTNKRTAVAMMLLAVAALPLRAGATITGGLAAGYNDQFDYPDASATNEVALDPAVWQTYPVASNGVPVANVWKVGTVDPGGVGIGTLTGAGAEIKALKQNTTGFGPSEPIAYVRSGDWQNMVVQVRAAFVGTSIDSGVGIIFRAPVDALTGIADKNNYYYFSAVNTTANKNFCTTGRCFVLGKRVGGAFFNAAKADTYLNLVGANGTVEPHTYKIVMSGQHILCYVDDQLVIETTDTPGDDISGTMAMPGPMFANGTVGLRTSRTKAWFDDFTVLGESPRSYEGRAAAMVAYGQVGQGANGAVFGQSAADSGFQYQDHDYGSAQDSAVISPMSPTNGVTGGALVKTEGKDGTVTSTAQLLGFSGVLSQTMPDGTVVNVSIASDSISSIARASCEVTGASAQLLNFTYLITVKTKDGSPLINEGKLTQVNPAPNTIVSTPVDNGGYVRIVLNSQKKTSDPVRTDASAVRIDFLQKPVVVSQKGTTVAHTGISYATAYLANVVAGRLCPQII